MNPASVEIITVLNLARMASMAKMTDVRIWDDLKNRIEQPLLKLEQLARRGALGLDDTDVLRSARGDLFAYEAASSKPVKRRSRDGRCDVCVDGVQDGYHVCAACGESR